LSLEKILSKFAGKTRLVRES